ncbi:acyl-CoA reductase [Cytophagaceae bacterium DM2B3-1]|uniref:Acyl-CoA reductase n=1 Tax=Xanthocytophaga flava TaxID=3048013 RepID=A0ABT7CRF4_9BACT|nr:acyl-CoA reductase [Xanthocytophaga flavus]MDJ1470433.1 acyl-CoA reductase [Xanthocytophaga flavus]MDJ1496271.1 acyl-CoA reductase [Xanthocytophaga flavus]
MTINERKAAFIETGNRLRTLSTEQLQEWQFRIKSENPWFTPENVQQALQGIVFMLEREQLDQWLEHYSFPTLSPKKIGVVMAGNIPAVGFHDLMCVLLSGHRLLAKLSSQDTFLIKAIASILLEVEPRFTNSIQFVERLTEADATIATGSDNSARYFHYYFGKKPNIIRQNRTSCAILTGEETTDELLALGHDITDYFGLGCRNVAKLYVPEGYNFTNFLESIESLNPIIHHHKFANNYDYQKAVFLVNQIPHFDNGFLLLTPNDALTSPMAVVYYESYTDKEQLKEKIQANHEKLQCIVSKNSWYPGSYSFGQTQCPSPADYADGVDTMAFLLNLS